MNTLRIRAEQINTIVGDISGNTQKIHKALKEAERAGVDLLVLPELVVCGYPPMDLVERAAFRSRVYRANDEIIAFTKKIHVGLIFGTFIANEKAGRRIFNAAILAAGGRKVHTSCKTLLPTYDIFDEFRYFEPNKHFETVEFRGVNLGITICEDIWNNQNEVVYHVYDVNPAAILKSMGAEILVNISASPFSKGKAALRLNMLRNHSAKLKIPIVYSNLVGANTEVIFDGDSMILDADGTIVAGTRMFEPSCADVELDLKTRAFSAKINNIVREFPQEERFFRALVLGLRDYLEKSGMGPKVLLGSSGGIDSALVAALAAEAVGPENVLAVTMPSGFSSEGSVSDSKALASALGIELYEVSISELYDLFGATLKPFFQDLPFGVAEENLQSRIRGVLLMALSNKFGHILLNTGNKSELAVGYCTLYGDMAGGLSVIADLYKTEVYALCRWLNQIYYQKEVIPEAILSKPPSAELRPDQLDSDSLPDYTILDEILRLYIEEQLSAGEIIDRGLDSDTVMKVLRLVDMNEYKRRQSPPGLRLSSKAFGIGRRLPIVQRWTGQDRVGG